MVQPEMRIVLRAGDETIAMHDGLYDLEDSVFVASSQDSIREFVEFSLSALAGCPTSFEAGLNRMIR